MRFLNQVFIIAVLCLIPSLIVVGFFKSHPSGVIVLWPIIFVLVLSRYWDDIVFKVEPNTALVIKNQVAGTLRVVNAGLHTRTFWVEKPFAEVSLKKRALVLKEDQYDTKDSIVLLSGTLEYRPDANQLLKFILLSEADLLSDVTAKAKSIIGEILSAKESEDAIKQRPQIQNEVYQNFKAANGHEQIEDAYGIEIIGFSVGSIKLDTELQRARTQEDVERRQKKSEGIELDSFNDQVDEIKKRRGFSDQQAMDYVMQMRGRGTRRIIIDMQGNEKNPNLELKLDDKD